MLDLEAHHGAGYVETTQEERRQTHVGWNDWWLMAALLRKVGYRVTEPAAAQSMWRDIRVAPRISRLLVCHRCGVIEIAAQSPRGQGYVWVSDDREVLDDVDSPLIGWMPLPPAALPLRTDCRCSCHGADGRRHELPCCRTNEPDTTCAG